MCMNCNAMCGKCRPPLLKGFVCPTCKKASILTRDDCMYILGYWCEIPDSKLGAIKETQSSRFLCKHCGTNLTETVRKAVVPKECQYSGIKCGWPCGKWNRTRRDDEPVCKKQIVARCRVKDKNKFIASAN